MLVSHCMKKWIDSLISHWVLTYDDSLWFCVHLASHLLVLGLVFPGLSMGTSRTFPHFSLAPRLSSCGMGMCLYLYTHMHTQKLTFLLYSSTVIPCHSCCFPSWIYSSCSFLLAGVKFEKFLSYLCSSPPETKATLTACVSPHMVKQTFITTNSTVFSFSAATYRFWVKTLLIYKGFQRKNINKV